MKVKFRLGSKRYSLNNVTDCLQFSPPKLGEFKITPMVNYLFKVIKDTTTTSYEAILVSLLLTLSKYLPTGSLLLAKNFILVKNRKKARFPCNLFQSSVAFQTETSQLICMQNQITGFYIYEMTNWAEIMFCKIFR